MLRDIAGISSTGVHVTVQRMLAESKSCNDDRRDYKIVGLSERGDITGIRICIACKLVDRSDWKVTN
jgi:hypothetical protein